MRWLSKAGLALVFCSVGLFLSFHSIAQTKSEDKPSLTIAVASNFQYPLSVIIQYSPYWKTYPLRIVTGSSGTLYSQIINGAPFDVFLSADAKRPRNLEQKGLTHLRTDYARGKLAIWPVDNTAISLHDLFQQSKKVAIANPTLAPFGEAAMAYLKQQKNADAIEAKLVLGANVTQAFQFVDSGNAQIGLIAESVLIQASQVLKKEKYSFYKTVESHKYPPIIQQAVVLKRTAQANKAQAFIEYLKSPGVQKILVDLGYLPVTDVSKDDIETQAVGRVVNHPNGQEDES
jgi:molybdenum ABC transporter molybdate-binding protein